MSHRELFVAQTEINKNLKNTSRKFPHSVLGSGAVKKLVESKLFPSSCRNRTGSCEQQTFKKKNRENHGSEFRKLKELKKLARYARLGKLKANSLAVEFRKLMKLKKLVRYAHFRKLKANSFCCRVGSWKTKTSKILLESLLF